MLSSLRSLFGIKSAPNASPATVERTRWFIVQPLHSVVFEDEAWGLHWCAQHGMTPAQLQRETLTLGAKLDTKLSKHLQQTFSRAKQGLPMHSLVALISCASAAHLNNFFDAFKAQPQVDATGPLVAMAFSVNRTEVAQYMGGLLEKTFDAWVQPKDPMDYKNHEIFDNANAAFIYGFQELMQHPRQMQWLFENNPTLLAKVTSPQSWAKLQEAVAHMPKAQKLMWPAVAHTVFDRLVHPVAAHWPLHEPDAFNTLTLSFAHDPAAQCCLMLQAKTQHWFAEHDMLDVSPANASVFVCRESLALRDHQRHVQEHTYDPDVQTRVSLLQMDLQETTQPEDFYQHARAVFSRQPTMELLLPELDGPNYV